MTGLKAVILACLLLCQTALAAGEVVQATVSMRDSGYMMGDFMHQRVTFHLPPSHSIDPDSLPLQGRVTSWLDLHHHTLTTQGELVTLELVWQLFATVETAQMLQTPSFQLKTNQTPALQIVVPSAGFHYSPMFAMPLEKVARKSDFAPTPFDESTPLAWLGVFATLSLCFFIVWGWLTDRLPWLPFQAGPLTRLARHLKGKPAAEISEHHVVAILHALNEAAGQSLYPSAMQVLYARAPYLNAFASHINPFFQVAWQHVYGYRPLHNTENHDALTTLSSLSFDWVMHAAIAERVYRRAHRGIEAMEISKAA